MRAPGRDAHLGVFRRIAERAAVRSVVLLPGDDPVAGDAEPAKRLANERRDHAQVLRDDLGGVAVPLGGLLDHRAEHPLAVRALGALAVRVEVAPLTRLADVHAEVADDVVEAEAVVEAGGVAGPGAEPFQVVLRHRRPVVRRQAPVLPLGGEPVRRRAERDVATELPRARPHVCALAADDERQVAHQLDAERLHRLARAHPLRVRDPLHVVVLEDRRRQRFPRAAEDVGDAVALFVRPLVPAPHPVRIAERDVEGEVLGPIALTFDPLRELLGARGSALPLAGVEALEPASKDPELERAGGGVVDARGGPELVEIAPAVGAESLVDRAAVEVLDLVDRDVDRVDAERGAGAIGARLTGGQLVRRQ